MPDKLGPLFVSQHRVTYNGVVLLGFGSLLKGAIAPDISVKAETQLTGFVQSPTVAGYDRGNRETSCAFTLVRQFATIWEAMADVFNFLTTIPTGGGNTIVEIANIAGQIIIPSSIISILPAKNEEVPFSIFTIAITGGLFSGAPLVANTITSENGQVILDENGNPVIGD